ncbi:hypothetical protein ATJ88_1949 [Isoptericola jiangsuensis]|uniref:Uncharacterized protein n=1 Tax=Isoptericola jiangsuensis TaxID=548579 RepID=A0A2A9EYG4_9MICO|nr:hypothetical protein [Isoptericola jiangsuensis]PFG43265.1 hypothetical protein ATJ88_1949 [Isoptericola jiangsuensis]
MDLLRDTLDAIWRVTLGGLVVGVGAPTLFAAGMAALGRGRRVSEDGTVWTTPPTTSGRLLAGTCFALVATLVVGGLALIVTGG